MEGRLLTDHRVRFNSRLHTEKPAIGVPRTWVRFPPPPPIQSSSPPSGGDSHLWFRRRESHRGLLATRGAASRRNQPMTGRRLQPSTPRRRSWAAVSRRVPIPTASTRLLSRPQGENGACHGVAESEAGPSIPLPTRSRTPPGQATFHNQIFRQSPGRLQFASALGWPANPGFPGTRVRPIGVQ